MTKIPTYDELTSIERVIYDNALVVIEPGQDEHTARVLNAQRLVAAHDFFVEHEDLIAVDGGWSDDDHYGNHKGDDEAPSTCETLGLVATHKDFFFPASIGCVDDATNDMKTVHEYELLANLHDQITSDLTWLKDRLDEVEAHALDPYVHKFARAGAIAACEQGTQVEFLHTLGIDEKMIVSIINRRLDEVSRTAR